MSDPRIDFQKLPVEIKENIFSKLPEISGWSSASFFGNANKRERARIEIDLSAALKSPQLIKRQKNKFIYWYQYIDDCYLNADYLKDRVLLNSLFYQMPLSYQWCALALYGKLTQRPVDLSGLDDYVKQQLLADEIYNSTSGLGYYIDIVSFFSKQNKILLIQKILNSLTEFKNTIYINQLDDVVSFLSESDACLLVTDANLKRLFSFNVAQRSWQKIYTDILIKLIRNVDDQKKINILSKLLSMADQTFKDKESVEPLLYLLNKILIVTTRVDNNPLYQALLSNAYRYIKLHLASARGDQESTSSLFPILELILVRSTDQQLQHDVDQLLNGLVIEDHSVDGIVNLPDLTSLNNRCSKESWQINGLYDRGALFVEMAGEIPLLGKEGLLKCFDIFKEGYQRDQFKCISAANRWVAWRNFLRNKFISSGQRVVVLNWIKLELTRRFVFPELVKTVGLLEDQDILAIFNAALAGYLSGPCVSLMDALLYLHSELYFPLIDSEIETIFLKISQFLLSAQYQGVSVSQTQPVSVVSAFMLLSNLAKQQVTEKMMVDIVGLLRSDLLPEAKWYLLQSANSFVIGQQYWPALVSYLPSMKASDDVVLVLANYIHFLGRIDPLYYLSCLDALDQNGNNQFLLKMLSSLAAKQLPVAAVERCYDMLNRCCEDKEKKVAIMVRLSSYSVLPSRMISQFLRNAMLEITLNVAAPMQFEILRHLILQSDITIEDLETIEAVVLAHIEHNSQNLLSALGLMVAWQQAGCQLSNQFYSEKYLRLLEHEEAAVREEMAHCLNASAAFHYTMLEDISSAEAVMLSCIGRAKESLSATPRQICY